MYRSDQKRNLKLISIRESLDLISKLDLKPLIGEAIPLYGSFGRVLEEDVIADFNIPSSDRAAIDGYAIRSSETEGASREKEIRFKVVREIFPSDTAEFEINTGETAYVACGAPLPLNADAVLWTEETKLFGDEIAIFRSLQPWENVERLGEDVRKGEWILRKGDALRPQDVGMLAALKQRDVRVFRVPKVAVISVGDELADFSTGNNEDKTANNYAVIVAGLLSEIGATPIVMSVVQDDMKEIENKIDEALTNADVVITIGGCSVGVRDFVPDALNALGKPGIIFHGVRLNLGKVTGLGIVKGKPVIMLPGRIVAAIASFYLFVAPLISLLRGTGWRENLQVLEGEMNEKVKAKPGRELFLLVRVERTDKSMIVHLIPKGANVLTNLLEANGYITVPEGKDVEKGEKIDVRLFDNKELTRINTKKNK